MHARIFIAAWLWAIGCTSPLFAAQTIEKIKLAIPAKSTGFEDMLREEELIGGLNFKVPPIEDGMCARLGHRGF